MRRPRRDPLVLAAQYWPSNAHLIADIAKLGYLFGDVLDATYGNGVWWKVWRPDSFTRHTGDFTRLLSVYGPGSFDCVAFDPPYVCPGGRETSNIKTFHERYGMDRTPKTPAQLQQLINLGLSECFEVVRWRGYIVVKVKDYISSGKLWDGTGKTVAFATEQLGLKYIDRFEHIGSPGPQSQTTQVHARRNLSTALVFQAIEPR